MGEGFIMSKERKKRAPWEILLRGCLLSLGIYFLGMLFLALLAVKGSLPESGLLPVLGVLCGIAGACGALPAVRGTPWGRLPAGLLSGAAFACVLLLIGACVWQGGFSWSGSGGALIACALGGGVLAAFLGGRKRRTGKRLRK